MCHRLRAIKDRNVFFVDDNCHPQTIDVVRTRAEPLGIEVVVGDHRDGEVLADRGHFGACCMQYPTQRRPHHR